MVPPPAQPHPGQTWEGAWHGSKCPGRGSELRGCEGPEDWFQQRLRLGEGTDVGLLLGGAPFPEEPGPLWSIIPARLVAPAWDPLQKGPGRQGDAGRAQVTYPEGPQCVVGRVGLLPAAPVHQALQLDQEELLGPGEVRGGQSLSGWTRGSQWGPGQGRGLSAGSEL